MQLATPWGKNGEKYEKEGGKSQDVVISVAWSLQICLADDGPGRGKSENKEMGWKEKNQLDDQSSLARSIPDRTSASLESPALSYHETSLKG